MRLSARASPITHTISSPSAFYSFPSVAVFKCNYCHDFNLISMWVWVCFFFLIALTVAADTCQQTYAHTESIHTLLFKMQISCSKFVMFVHMRDMLKTKWIKRREMHEQKMKKKKIIGCGNFHVTQKCSSNDIFSAWTCVSFIVSSTWILT